ncbi:MAG: MaoC/PaaZ C-terminal domain-containing protein [Gaiellaceae bacterium]
MTRFDELAVGDGLPALTKSPEREDLVKYAAGSGDFNPLHFDPEHPQARQLGDNLVHGRLKYAAIGQLVSDWLGHEGWIRRIAAQYRGMDRRGAPFTCRGRVSSVREESGATVVDLELWTENAEGERTTTGSAEVVIPGG